MGFSLVLQDFAHFGPKVCKLHVKVAKVLVNFVPMGSHNRAGPPHQEISWVLRTNEPCCRNSFKSYSRLLPSVWLSGI